MTSSLVFLSFNFFVVLGAASNADDPCAVRQAPFGAVCVCNSSYCDTVERPPPLPRGDYYHYSTSGDSPGFYHTTGNFYRERPKEFQKNTSIVFTVNPGIQYQEILGFGGSFTDSAGMAIDSLPFEAQAKLIESYFGSNGIEYSMGRVAIGMTDFSTRNYTYDDVENDDEMVHFQLVNEDYKYKIPLIREAMRMSPHKMRLVGCAFASPSWMKTTNGILDGYIKQKHLQAWAKYHVKFLDAYAKYDIPFWALTGGNEVMVMIMFQGLLPIGFEAMPHSHMEWLSQHLTPQLAASNHSEVKFLILDDMRPFAKFWLSRFARDPVAYKLVDGVALHWYLDWISNASLVDELHQNFPDKLFIYTESSTNFKLFGGQPIELGSWHRAALYAYNIIENLNHWTSGYLDWNLALDTDGGPYILMPLDAAIMVNATGEEFYKNPMFYAIGHFSKFIPPGSRRVDVKSNQEKPPVFRKANLQEEIYARLLDRRGLVAGSPMNGDSPSTTLGPETTTSRFPFPFPFTAPKELSCLATVNSDNSSSVIIFNGKDTDVNVTIEDTVSGYITSTLPANSINTFVYWPQA